MKRIMGPAAAGRSTWSAGGIRYAGEFWFPAPVEDFWRTIESFDSYRTWWPWLREFRTDNAGLVDGNVLRGTVVPPFPWPFRLEVRLHSCQRLSVTKAELAGDVRGEAAMYFSEHDGGTRVRVVWTLFMVSAPMRMAARVARPLVLWGHDRVVEMTVAALRPRGVNAADNAARSRADTKDGVEHRLREGEQPSNETISR